MSVVASKAGTFVSDRVSAITDAGRAPARPFTYSAAPSGWQPLPSSAPPPAVTQCLLGSEWVPLCDSSPWMRSTAPPAAASRSIAFVTGGAYTQFSA